MKAGWLRRSWLTMVLASAALGAVGCSAEDSNDNSGSGVDRSKYLDQLTEDEVTALCDWHVQLRGGQTGSFACSDGTSATVYTSDECKSCINGTAIFFLVSRVEDCAKGAQNSVCGSPTTDCQMYLECMVVPNP